MTPPSLQAIQARIIERARPFLADWDASKAFVAAPCIFCGYNGAGYSQAGTHPEGCPWHTVGGVTERLAVVAEIVIGHLQAAEARAASAERERDAFKSAIVSERGWMMVLAPCRGCRQEWPHPSVYSTSPVCESCRHKELAALTLRAEAAEQWKAEQQSALIAMAVELVTAGCPHAGVVDGVRWLRERAEAAERRVRELEQTT